ncbi:MAG: MlaD family protein [Alphaproteobacteria bacterium]|nr:MlaD family protein [Alphaproteobacteria bacterium]MDP3532750.1 MlaD family protein [Alphaproteobacteria bacterium]
METKGYYLTVGIFVLSILVGAIFFSIWLYEKTGGEGLPYTIYFKSSVTGLNQGSGVIYQGVPIGKVTKISVDPEVADQVKVDVTIQDDFPVYKDTYAQLEMKGITGGLLVQLRGGSVKTTPLEHTRKMPSPIIQSRPSHIEELFTSAPKLIKNFSEVAESLNQILTDKTKTNVTGIIDDIKDVTGAISRKTKSIESAIDEAANLFDDGVKFVRNFDKQIDSIAGFFKQSLTGIKDASSKVGNFSDQVAHLVKENRQGVLDFTSTGLYEFSQLLNEMRDLIIGVTRVSKKIENSRILFGDTSKGVVAK